MQDAGEHNDHDEITCDKSVGDDDHDEITCDESEPLIQEPVIPMFARVLAFTQRCVPARAAICPTMRAAPMIRMIVCTVLAGENSSPRALCNK